MCCCCCSTSDLPTVVATAAPPPFVLAVAVAASRSGSGSPPPQQQKPSDMYSHAERRTQRTYLCELTHSRTLALQLSTGGPAGAPHHSTTEAARGSGGLSFQRLLTCSMNKPDLLASQSTERAREREGRDCRSLCASAPRVKQILSTAIAACPELRGRRSDLVPCVRSDTREPTRCGAVARGTTLFVSERQISLSYDELDERTQQLFSPPFFVY